MSGVNVITARQLLQRIQKFGGDAAIRAEVLRYDASRPPLPHHWKMGKPKTPEQMLEEAAELDALVIKANEIAETLLLRL
jgi:hypothetical protein